MSEFTKIFNKPTVLNTPLEAAIIFTWAKHPGDAENAADELAALRAENEKLTAALEIFADGDNWTHAFDQDENPVVVWDYDGPVPVYIARKALEKKQP